jgi:hypothetical protein
MSLGPLLPGAYCFKVMYPPGLAFDAVSCSVPWDAMGNRGLFNDGYFPTTLETALFYKNKLTYIDGLGYEDVCRFDSDDDLINELVRLADSELSGSGIVNADVDSSDSP